MSDTEYLMQTLKEAGLRRTPQREAICAALTKSRNHPTATDIYAELKPRFASLSLATVYNTLDALVKLGAINALGHAGDDAVHYDADTEPHVNLACIVCSRIVDIHSKRVSQLDKEVVAASGYRLLGARVMYYGLCPRCQKKKKEIRGLGIRGLGN
ncbi:MAG: transcriptional repressor [Anaerolineales bacterium]|nr:transcriptional repressor [Anaerolineales bacterium]